MSPAITVRLAFSALALLAGLALMLTASYMTRGDRRNSLLGESLGVIGLSLVGAAGVVSALGVLTLTGVAQ